MKRTSSRHTPPAASRRRLHHVAVASLVLAMVAAVVMSIRHIWAITLPGCGQFGGCEWAITGPYSKLFGWPVAFLGLGYFVASLCILSLSRQTFPERKVLWIVRLGAVVSLVFIAIMLWHSRICLWCALTHLGNLIFWAISEQLGRRAASTGRVSLRNSAIAALAGLLTIAGLQLSKSKTATVQEAENYRKGMESVEKIGADTLGPTDPTPAGSPTGATSIEPKPADKSKTISPRFGGRYWDGSPNATVRIVVFHDYQCELCREVEAAIAQLMARRSDVAFSVKQWPFDAACNRFILGTNMHPGACEAAKVAEVAGSVGGEKAFWGMHHWLVARGGQFTPKDLKSRLGELGIDQEEFGQKFNEPIVDSLVRADIEEGMAFGLTFTPLVFVNGYKVEGWQSAGVLPAAIVRAAEVAKLRPRRNDRPDLAMDIQYRQWLSTPATTIPLRPNEQSRGPVNSQTTVVVYGDLTCAFHASAYATFDGILRQYPDVRYIYRDFPLGSDCNKLVKQQINARACEVSRWALAVGRLAGEKGYWKAHEWIVRSRDHLENVTIENLGRLVGLNPEEIRREANSPEVERDLQANLSLAIQMGVTMSPTIYVNGKIVAGWRTPGVLDRVVSTATKGAP